MANMDAAFEDRHNTYYAQERPSQNAGRVCAPGSQYLVHLLRGGYLGPSWRSGEGRRALDVGCGSGYNAVTLAMLGWRVSACEITPEILEHARATIAGYGYDLDLRPGENEHLPFPDQAFDLRISMGVIHYCPSAEAVGRSAAEYARVLKPGGLLILLTNHPDNWTVADGTRLDGDVVRVRCPGDYRDGQLLYLFRDPQHLGATFSDAFEDIRTGINRTTFFTRTLVHQVMAATKK